MALKDDLTNKILSYKRGKYEIQETKTIPSAEDTRLTYGNNGLTGDYTFLFADIRKSSQLIATYGPELTAKILQSYHDICVRVIISKGGEIRSFDGDRVMGVFVGNLKCSNAVEAAMKIQSGVKKILNPTLGANIKCGIGIDYGQALITKVGKGANVNNNDVVWIGKATNYASHLCNEADDCIIISDQMLPKLHEKSRYYISGTSKVDMWDKTILSLKTGDKIQCYKSAYTWNIP